MPATQALRVAIVGAGLAGAACARALTAAGHAVQVFDKARGPGGRLATRRAEWLDAQGRLQTTPLDHGAVGWSARTAAFRGFVAQAVAAGRMAAWPARPAPGSLPLDGGGPLFLPTPDMPALCRHLLGDTAATWQFAVDTLLHGPQGWQLQAQGQCHAARFDAVLLALPPAQAAPLLNPHRADWARHAAVVAMQPCWTLLGVADADADAGAATPAWDLARPPEGPLAWALRSDARPGRPRVPGQAHWVAHARAGWSRRHLEQPPQWVQQQLQSALEDLLERPLHWRFSTVHRWRYAQPNAQAVASADLCWWDAAHGLGVCGDFLGGHGAEGAWLSAQALAEALLQPRAAAFDNRLAAAWS